MRAADQVCPGYVIALPQAIEAAMCAAWLEKGSLTERLDGQPVTGILRDSIDAFRSALSAVESHLLTEARQ